ncbi:hypothetical protein ZIOFF_004754 [Zingiber officinale]|uniref:GDSL esterase/lipase n=1 Tax=Zingiber officinale TaxID=94328 RepID=A0A8J5LR83_ZINOF|nr:hypothetical protein ZIOFF_004754 [Zingiber officinale]
MASSSFSFFQILSATTTLLLLLEAHQASSCFSAIFSFGDSLQDTGNAAHMFVNSALSNPPYGTTYFHKATGAKTFVVPGNLPIGCIPAWLGQYRSDKPSDYDRNGCLIWMNNFSEYHNNHLQTELDRLKGQFPNVNIAYADYLNSGIRMFSNQAQFGITVPFIACCGGNGYPCNATGPVCPNPLNHASWEGFHPTEATYHAISDGIIRGPYAIPFLSQKC